MSLNCGHPNPHNHDGNCDVSNLCDPVVNPKPCCPTGLPMAAETCPVVVPAIQCAVENRTMFHVSNAVNGALCDCLCLPEGVTFSVAQLDAVKGLLHGILTTLSPYRRCPDTCEILNDTVGHQIPLNGDCCDSYDHSPFLHSGLRRNIGGGNPHYFTDLDSGGIVYHHKLGQLFCCAQSMLEGAVTP